MFWMLPMIWPTVAMPLEMRPCAADRPALSRVLNASTGLASDFSRPATAPATAHALWAGHPPSAGPASVYLVGGYDDGGGPSSTGPAVAAAALASLAAHARAATVRLAALASCDAAGRPVATGLALPAAGEDVGTASV